MTHYWQVVSVSLFIFLFGSGPSKEILARTPSATSNHQAAAEAFAEGERLVQDRMYLKAITAFEEAYRQKPFYLVQCSIARCYENLGQMLKASKHYRQCLSEGRDSSDKLEAIEKALQSVINQITQVKIYSALSDCTLYVNGAPMGNPPLTIELDPGKHLLEVRRANSNSAERAIQTFGGETLQFDLTPTPSQTVSKEKAAADHAAAVTLSKESALPPSLNRRRTLSPAYFWTGAALSVVAASVAAVFGVKALSARADYEETPTQAGYDHFIQQRLLTNILAASAAALAGTTATLFFFTNFSRDDPSAKEARDNPTLTVGMTWRSEF